MDKVRFAFFDVDETLINLKSMFSFRAFYHRHRFGALCGPLADRLAHRRLMANGRDRAEVNRAFYRAFRGHSQLAFAACARKWFAEVSKQPSLYIAPVLDALQRHRAEGIEPVFVSGSSVEILQPLADALGVRHVLANRLEVSRGRFTGELLPPQTIGDGKRAAVDAFLAQHGASAARCYGYGDHLSDLPLLEAVGLPTVVVRDPALVEVAHARGWPVLNPDSIA